MTIAYSDTFLVSKFLDEETPPNLLQISARAEKVMSLVEHNSVRIMSGCLLLYLFGVPLSVFRCTRSYLISLHGTGYTCMIQETKLIKYESWKHYVVVKAVESLLPIGKSRQCENNLSSPQEYPEFLALKRKSSILGYSSKAAPEPGSAPGCRNGNGEKLSITQAVPVQAI